MILSIIVPVYNGEKVIEVLFASLGSSLPFECEVIIVDDGSTDGTYNKCIEFAQKKDNVRLIHNINHGVSYSRNVGIKNAKGDYLMFVDADDALSEGWFDNINKAIRESNYSDFIIFSKEKNEVVPNVEDMISTIIGISNKFRCNYLNAPWSKLFKRSFLQDNNIFFDDDILHGEDAIFNILVLLYGANYYFYNKTIYIYKVNQESVTHSYNNKFLESNKKYLEVISEILYKTPMFSNSEYKTLWDYSFVNSIYLFVGKISKLSSSKERHKAIRGFYEDSFYSEKLASSVSLNYLSLTKKVIYFFVKLRLLALIILIVSILRRRPNNIESIWINI